MPGFSLPQSFPRGGRSGTAAVPSEPGGREGPGAGAQGSWSSKAWKQKIWNPIDTDA